MKINMFYLAFLIITIFSCRSQTIDSTQNYELDEYILVNEQFINTIKDKIIESQTKALNQEKYQFTKRNIIDSNYLKTLNRLIENPYVTYNDVFFDTHLKELAYDKLKGRKVKSLYFLDVQFHGGSIILKYNIVIIEDLDHQIEIFSFSNKTLDVKHRKITDHFFMDFIHEYMLNIPYSFEGKSLFNNNVQYFSLERVTPIDKNDFSVESVVVPEMLNYQLEIFKTFLDFEL